MKTTKIVVDKRDVHVQCPHCNHGESHTIDEQRHHIQTFDIKTWLPDRENFNEFSIMVCHVCTNEFSLEWDYENEENEETTVKSITTANAKELALITSFIIRDDMLNGTVNQTFDKAYELAQEFILIHPEDKNWEDEELDFDEVITTFVSDKLKTH